MTVLVCVGKLKRLLKEARADYVPDEPWHWGTGHRPALKSGGFTALTIGSYYDGGADSHEATLDLVVEAVNALPALLELVEAAEKYRAHNKVDLGLLTIDAREDAESRIIRAADALDAALSRFTHEDAG